jgi:hypothetical protein
MKFMLLMNAPRGTSEYDIFSWAPEDFQRHVAYLKRLGQELRGAGELVSVEGLVGPSQARIVRANRAGAPEVTDGPVAESKEFLAGFWIVDVDTPQRAYEIAARQSSAPGPGGASLNIPIEVREVMSSVPASEA